ncbi:tripartite motif-containing protein 10-like [Varanus komodoensis]|uniref:tripartite motif-containing protein 10-like n=1 Tax=Varanus komodoensis TaxID=61221 RepID=UPI001CF7CA58|nr:tripartite motif-containing protein 10-like [Varanus komodoensis]
MRTACNTRGLFNQKKKVPPVVTSQAKDKKSSSVVSSAQLALGVEEEVKCPICHEYLTNAVSVDCGHNYCQTCILSHCRMKEHFGEEVTCPLCQAPIQRENIRPNWPLRNLVEKIKHFPLRLPKENLCRKHKEKLSLFCTEDGELVCVDCDKSSEHKAHVTLLLRDAAQEYRTKIQTHLELLKEEREKLQDQKLAEELESLQYLTELEMEKQKIKSAFVELQLILEEKQHFWLFQLDNLEKEIVGREKRNLTKLSVKIFQLSKLISEMEGKCQLPEREFLQDIQCALSRCKNLEKKVVDLSPKLENRLRICSQQCSALEKAMEECQVSVNPEPDVAYPWCILSSRLESVTRVWKIRDLPRNPERCDCTPFVLGSKAFTSGRHWWEVNTGAWGTLDWAVGVARDSLRKKPYVRLNPKEGVWAVGSIFNASASVCQLSALTFPKPSPLRVKKQPREIRVCLDYEAGLVEFFSADNNELIFMFHVESFSGEKIRPFFWNRKSSSTGIGQEVKM